jgi:Small-conductance mechanosensitive channel
MAIPFASAYQPINLLNDAIQAQQARQNQGYLQASALNDASVADSLNRIVQQKALDQQSRDRQAHYGLQQQQLANDLAYRNAALKEAEARSIEQARQFDKQFGLNKQLTEAQIKQLENPFYGQKDAFGYSVDAEAKNQEADGAASELNRKKKQLDAFHASETARIGKQWFQAKDLKALDDSYQAALLALKVGVPGAERTRFNPGSGEFESLHISVPMGRTRSSEPSDEEAPNVGPVRIGKSEGPGEGTGEGTMSMPFSGFQSRNGAATEIRPDAAVVSTPAPLISNFVRPNPLAITAQPFVGFGQGNVRTNTPPAVVAAPTLTVQPIPAAQAAEGVHFRTNPDGSVIVLRPIVGLNGKILAPGNILRP